MREQFERGAQGRRGRVLALLEHEHELLHLVAHTILDRLDQLETNIMSKLDDAFLDLDAAIKADGDAILALVAQLAAVPPGPNADAIAQQIEDRVAVLKGQVPGAAPAAGAVPPPADNPPADGGPVG